MLAAMLEHPIAYLVLGLATGIMSATFGVGGGILMVPLLVMFYAMPQKSAQGLSLAAMVPMVITGAFRYWYNPQIHVDLRMAVWIALGGIGGAFLGAWIAHALPAPVLKRMFAILLVVAAARMWWSAGAKPSAKAAGDGLPASAETGKEG